MTAALEEGRHHPAPALAGWVELHPVPDAGRADATWLLVNRRDGICIGLTHAEASALPSQTSAELADDLAEGGFLEGSAEPPRRGRLRALVDLEVRTRRVDRLARGVYRLGGRALLHPVAVIVQLLLGAAGTVAVLRAVLGSHEVTLRVHPAQVPIVIGMGCAAIVVHELCHALVVIHGGGRVDSAGVRLHLGTPAFFVESIDAQLLPRRQRLAQAVAGPWSEWLVGSAVALWLWVGSPGPVAAALLYRFVLLNSVTVLSNLLPFVGLDGYWLLADVVRQPDLGQRARGACLRVVSALVLRQPVPRRERLLAAYSAANAAVAAALFVLAMFVWYQLFAGVITGLIVDGPLGWVALLTLAAVLGRPAVGAALPRLAAAAAALSELGSVVRFRLEFGWRVAAVRAMAASDPAIAALDEQALSVLAGQLTRAA